MRFAVNRKRLAAELATAARVAGEIMRGRVGRLVEAEDTPR